MKRLLDEAEPSLGRLTELVASAERYQSSPFAKRAVHSRISRVLEGGRSRQRPVRSGLLATGGLLVCATAAAASYSYFAGPKEPAPAVAPALEVAPRLVVSTPVVRPAAPLDLVEPPTVQSAPLPSVKRTDRLAAGEDPSRVAEAVRALRKQGNPARAQQLLDQYLRENPRGALAEDALALSIEAAAARKDPRAADYAKRYLARYPNGRFRGVAERALARQ